MARGPEGADVGEFPIAELTIDNIRRVWGPGHYRVQFIGQRKGQRRPLGSRIITVHPAAGEQPAAAVVASEVGEPSQLREAFQILDAIDRRAQIAAERDRDFLRTVMEMGMQRAGEQSGAQLSQVTQAIAGLASSVQALQEQVIAIQSDDDDGDEDDDDDDASGDDARGPFRPGEPIKDVIVSEGLNEVAQIVKELAPAAKEYFITKMMLAAREAQQKAEADEERRAAEAAAKKPQIEVTQKSEEPKAAAAE